MKYRKKAVIVEASQWWKPGDHAAVTHPLPPELSAAARNSSSRNAIAPRADFGAIKTLEGWMLVTPGDFIIRGVHGEHYACKPDIFAKTYEPAEDEPAA